jgi:hypothetical protein
MHQNKRIRYAGHEYEIFWTSQHARHICSNFNRDKLHDIHHEDIAQLLEYYDAVVPEFNDRYTFLNWHNQRGYVYELHVYLVKGSRNRPGRCVVLTGYRSNKQQYLALAAQAQKQS